MECSERTKRRRIAAKVAEHFQQVSLETEIDPSLEFQFGFAHEDSTQDRECVHDDFAHNVGDNVLEEPIDIFYDAMDTDIE